MADSVKKLTIDAEELVADIRSGLDDSALMDKYQIPVQKLGKVLLKLVRAHYLTPQELYERAKLTDSQITKAFVEAQQAMEELE